LRTLEFDDHIYDLAFHGDYIYGSTRNSEKGWMLIIDQSDFENPAISQAHITGDGWINTVELIDELLYVGSSDSLFILDVKSPADPKIDTSLFTGWIYDISFVDGLALMTRQGHGISIFNISDLQKPTLISKINRWASHLQIKMPYVYALANGSGPIYVHDITNVANPLSSISTIAFGDRNTEMEISGTHGFIAQNGQVVILDIENPKNPQKIGSIPTKRCTKIEVTERHCYMAQGRDGWQIADISNIEIPLSITEMEAEDQITDILVRDDLAYLADRGAGIKIYNVTDPSSPIEMGRYMSGGNFEKIVLVDSFVYAYERDFGLKIINASNPMNPIISDSLPYRGGIDAMVRYDTLLYLGINGNNRILNISDPAHPNDMDLIFYWQSPTDFVIVDDTLFVAEHYDGLHAYDLTDPINPELISSFEYPYRILDLLVQDGRVYVLDQDAGLYIVKMDRSTTAGLEIASTDVEIFTVYPNPLTEYLNIILQPTLVGNVTFQLHHVNGQMVMERRYKSPTIPQRIDMRHLTVGKYILTVKNAAITQSKIVLKL